MDDLQNTAIAPNTDYGASNIDVLEGLEAVRVRPGMYIGDTDDGSGLHHMVFEILDNALDEAQAGHADEVSITLLADGGVRVGDNGRGIPVDMHPTKNRPAIELVFMELHAGGKFNQNSYKTSGGLHGVGASVVNALSTRMTATVFRGGKEYAIGFKDGGFLDQKLHVVSEGHGARTGTVVTFWPSSKTFPNTEFDPARLKPRIRQLAFLNSGVRIVWKDEIRKEETVYFFEGGLAEFVRHLDKDATVLMDRPIVARATRKANRGDQQVDIEVDAAFQWNDGETERLVCFANNIQQADGGTHLAGFRAAVTSTMKAYADANQTGKNQFALDARDLAEGLTAVISVKLPDPKFSAQTKSKLVSSEVQAPVQAVVTEALRTWLEEHPVEARRLIAKALLAAEARERARKAREQIKRKGVLELTTLPGKLSDCQEKDASKCELFIVEGDSAGGSAKQARDRRTQAVLPLRGKTLNTERLDTLDKILTNDQLGTLLSALGCGIGEYFDINKLRYHRIVIMTDADDDGSHIRTLLLNFFYRWLPELLTAGYVWVAQPPLFATTPQRSSKMTYHLDQPTLDRFLVSQGAKGLTLVSGDGAQRLSGDDLVKMAIDASRLGQMISAAHVGMGLPSAAEELTDCLAVTGAWHPSVFEDASMANDVAQQVADVMCQRMPGTTWSGASDGGNMVFSWRRRGVVNRVTIPGTVAATPAVATLLRHAESLTAWYLPVANLVDEAGLEIPIMGPRQLFDILSDRGSKGLSEIKRFKGLGEMNPDQLKLTTLDPATRTMLRLVVDDAEETHTTFSMLMGKNVEPRRDFIIENAENVADIDS